MARKFVIITEGEAAALSRLKTKKDGNQREQVYKQIKGRLGTASRRFARKVVAGRR
jgi:hypothetical protein